MDSLGDQWQYHSPVAIRCGPGCLESLPDLTIGPTALLVTSRGFTERGVVERLRGLLRGVSVTVLDDVTANPTIRELDRHLERLGGAGFASVVALGGGSVIDTGKVLAAAVAVRPGERITSLELVRATVPMPCRTIQLIAVPTTAGTGSEVTPFATVWDDELRVKRSISSPSLLPAAALLDPTLAVSLPRSVTVSSGLDAVSQAMEALWNRHATPITDSLAIGAAGTALSALPAVLASPGDLAARQRMMEAALQAGLAIARTRTALAHSISYPLTAHYGLPHGIACSFTLPAILTYNAVAGQARMDSVVQRLGFSTTAALRSCLEELLAVCGVSDALRDHGVDAAALRRVMGEMIAKERAENTLRSVDKEGVEEILRDVASYLPELGG